MKRNPKGRLELTWMGKDMALIPVADGKYDYAWVDPNDPRALEVKPIEILEQVGEVDGSTGANENLLIIGDSGDALRSLGTIPEYSEKYLGQIKLVYIDPPFNTEQTFEHYADQLEHSIWLTMMRDRIRDIKPLLAPDASVWVHLDDAEVHRMRVLLDEEFGADNFVGTVVWQKRYSRESRPAIGEVHDSIHVYAVDAARWKNVRNKLPREQAKEYKNPDNDPRGPWRIVPMTAPGTRANQQYEIVGPDGTVHRPPRGRCWSTIESGYKTLLANGRIRFGITGKGAPGILRYLDEDEGLTPWTWWPHDEVGHTDESKKEIQALFPDQSAFDTPKPERLLSRIIHIATSPDDLVMDFFGGSGTTAAVAHKMGRRWLTVELNRANVETFAVPRLTCVVEGKDFGGVTTRTERIGEEVLPEGVTPGDAQTFSTLLGKFTDGVAVEVDVAAETAKHVRRRVKMADPPLDPQETKTLLALLKKVRDASGGGGEVDLLPVVQRRLKALAKTRDNTTVLWEGGGGFTVAKIGSSMYEVDDDDGEVLLSPDATNGAWSKAIAGQLRFALTPDDPVFCGVRNRQRLAVIDGVADENVVRTVVEHLGDKEKAVIVAKGMLPEAAELLQSLSPGSRIRKAPDDMFPKGTVN